MSRTFIIAACLICAACASDGTSADVADALDAQTTLEATETATGDAPEASEASGPPESVAVLVRLDGEPAAGVVVSQGGLPERWTTDEDGRAVVTIDPAVEGDLAVVASHPDARVEAAMVWNDTQDVIIDLERFDPTDNPDYEFQNPGMPGHSPTSAQCGHCHKTIAEDFFTSQHPTAASNPVLQDLYAGVSAALEDKASCEGAGGIWKMGLTPGSREPGERCYLGAGVLPTLNPDCESAGCDDAAVSFGGCADCHAPGIDGALGGRDLLEATGYAYERGIHCDVCHHVEGIADDAPAGVAGRLGILRPSDPSSTPSFGDWRPLLFGPHDDIPNPFMGIVQRLVFQESRFCFGCHDLEQEVLVPGHEIDAARWPTGKLPILSTYAEWMAKPGSPSCQTCHMPPDPDVDNTADLQLFPSTVGVVGGWKRPVPSVRRHVWSGPRSEARLLAAKVAKVTLEAELVDDVLTVTATTKNTRAAHGLPTGEPLRSVLLLVEASCGDDLLTATGGDAVPDFGGALERKLAGEDWSRWPGAAPGDIVRVVQRSGDYYDYQGFGPFGDGTFTPAERGMPVEHVVGQSRITAVDDGVVTFEEPLPLGDVAYLVASSGFPVDGDDAGAHAGRPGFGFARVLVGPEGQRMVPHFLALDVASDNRLMAGASWTSTHQFKSTCDEPDLRAALVYRRYPLALARERGWEFKETVLSETNL